MIIQILNYTIAKDIYLIHLLVNMMQYLLVHCCILECIDVLIKGSVI